MDIATNTPDEINGRFAVLGWAHSFITNGTVVRHVTWTKDNIASFVSCMSVLVMGCDKEKFSKDKYENLRTTINPIEKRLCHLPKIKSVKWKVQTFGNDDRWISVPGPNSYRIKGYAKFEIDELEKVISKFDNFIKDAPCVDFPYSQNEEKYNWICSQLFT
ncbi:hypothetical protein [Akkermansia sp.]|uniref:hypothetical protein n=1 Tax=Akkermansia sp. TaxID=1872421 RepID=UPI0025BA8026|nr:hypothetical protein [Akkermansia sp.]MCC8147582.1 hypothetical protein [Akkermansia sp.]